ncbi:MAG TPA: hypothetical protein VEG84_02090 [Thermoanaerobaculia bacterium]|nr:hypothetical protein [Thermoanaerobaculia bacterium]
MSLIDDALKRAQTAGPLTAERTPAWTPTHLPDRRPAAGRYAFSLAVIAGLTALAAGVWLFSRRPAPVAPHPVSPAHTETSASVPAEAAGRIAGPEVIVPPLVVPPAAVQTKASEDHLRHGAKTNEVRTASDAPGQANPVATHPAAASAAVTEHTSKTLVDGKSYSGEISIPGGARIELDGIVYSDQNPVALLNGRVLAPGEGIEGMTLSKVEPDRVELQGHGVTVYLLVK